MAASLDSPEEGPREGDPIVEAAAGEEERGPLPLEAPPSLPGEDPPAAATEEGAPSPEGAPPRPVTLLEEAPLRGAPEGKGAEGLPTPLSAREGSGRSWGSPSSPRARSDTGGTIEGEEAIESEQLDSFNPASSRTPAGLQQRQQQQEDETNEGFQRMRDFFTGKTFRPRRKSRVQQQQQQQQQQQEGWGGDEVYPLLRYQQQQQQMKRRHRLTAAAAALLRKSILPTLVLCLFLGAFLQHRAASLSQESSRLEAAMMPGRSEELLLHKEAAGKGGDTWRRMSPQQKAVYNARLMLELQTTREAIAAVQQQIEQVQQERKQRQQQQQQQDAAAVEELGETGKLLAEKRAAALCSQHALQGLERQAGTRAAAAAAALQQLQQYAEGQQKQAAALEARLLLMRMLEDEIAEIRYHTNILQEQQQGLQEFQELLQMQRQRDQQEQQQQQQQQQQKVDGKSTKKDDSVLQQEQRLQMLEKEIDELLRQLAEARIPPIKQQDQQEQQQEQQQQQQWEEKRRSLLVATEKAKLRLARLQRLQREFEKRANVWRTTMLGPLGAEAEAAAAGYQEAVKGVEKEVGRLLLLLQQTETADALSPTQTEVLLIQEGVRRMKGSAGALSLPLPKNKRQNP
ncbi:hypothetical protein Emed_006059 [Eimeria media]